MLNSLAIELSALNILQSTFQVPKNWFKDYSNDGIPDNISYIKNDDVVFLLGPHTSEKSRLLIIDLKNSDLFDGLDKGIREEAFLRILKIGKLSFNPGKLIPPIKWLPYHSGALLSIQSNSNHSNEKARVEIDLNPRGSNHTYVYKLDKKQRDLKTVEINYEIFDHVISNYEDAVLRHYSNLDFKHKPTNKVILSPLLDKLSLGFSHTEWVNAKLTKEQQDFVFSDLNKCIRLVGSAGTGKTLSLTVKCLHEFKNNKDVEGGFRCLFLTHNTSTSYNVSQSLDSMDNEGLRSHSENSFILVCTLQELANEAIQYSLHDLQPLSMDGYESKKLQLEVIQSVIRDFIDSDWVTYKSGCTEDFSSYIEADVDSAPFKNFSAALMNEFACVLEAEGVKRSADKITNYIKESRKNWMMKLNNEEERKVVLFLYEQFRKILRQMNAISSDQMISDFLGHLDSNAWDNLRNKNGYDLIFVDELHLFNRQERMTFHNLMRDAGQPPKIIMAYDSKQSPYDTFCNFNHNENIANTLGLGQTIRFKLEKAFRYTQPIANLLEWIDKSFPAVGIEEELGEDWENILIDSECKDGIKPKLVRAQSTKQIFEVVFKRAQRASRDLRFANNVAILCASESQFERYSVAAKYKDSYILISDRDQISNINHNNKRFIFSMPEYVAGVQFDTVYLIEVNQGEVDENSSYYSSAFRRFISTVYVGSSRAERVLEVYTSDERGGASSALKYAIENDAFDVVNINDID